MVLMSRARSESHEELFARISFSKHTAVAVRTFVRVAAAGNARDVTCNSPHVRSARKTRAEICYVASMRAVISATVFEYGSVVTVSFTSRAMHSKLLS